MCIVLTPGRPPDGLSASAGNPPGARTAAVAGQTWSMGVYLRLISGVFPWTVQIGFAEQTSGGAALTYDMSGSLLPTTAALATQQFSTAQTLIYAQTVGIAPMLWLYSQQSGQAVDVTFRIAGIQVEQGGTATSYIPTIGTSQTRGAAIGTEVVRQAVHPTGLENSARNWIRNGDATGAVAAIRALRQPIGVLPL